MIPCEKNEKNVYYIGTYAYLILFQLFYLLVYKVYVCRNVISAKKMLSLHFYSVSPQG